MSSMLDQAIIDASALKEAAIQNAESVVIEKYSNDIREAIDRILEEPEVDFEEEDESSEFVDQVPMATTDSCPCPDEGQDEPIVIDFDALEAQMQEEIDTQGDLNPSEMLDREELAEEIEDEEVELNEDDLSELINQIVDGPGEVSEGPAPMWLRDEEEDEEDGVKKQVQEMFDKEINELVKENRRLNDKIDKNKKVVVTLKKENKEYKKMIHSLNNTLGEVNLSNAKLLYTNKILDSDSLNERQKDRLVEAITGVKSIEEAKTIFETLQSAVGAGTTKRTPKSLSEVVTKRSSAFLHRKESKKVNPIMERMQILAGIKNN